MCFTQSARHSGNIMWCLFRLKETFGLFHKYHDTTLILTLLHLALHTTASCTSEYHQRHELRTSGTTVERHDVYNTFSSVLQIMLIAKQQLITQVDEEKNLVMSRKDCKLIGTGLSFQDIHQMNSTYDGVAKLARDIIVGEQIMVNGDTTSALLSATQYIEMISVLNLQHNINLAGDHALMVVKNGPDNIITNIDNRAYREMDVICTISQDYLNIRNIVLPALRELHKIFNNILAAAKIFPQVLNTADMQACLGFTPLEFWHIMQMDENKLERCLNTHARRDKRSFLTWIDGSQAQIDSVAHALDATINTFNEDLSEIESFNRQVASGYNHLQLEMAEVEEYINSLRDIIILEEVKSDIRQRKTFYYRMRMSESMNFNNIVLNSDTSELVRILNNCVYGALTCTIASCETALSCGVTRTSEGMDVLEIHREYAQLHNSQGYLISCEPISPTHISSWHGHLAAGYGNNSVVIQKKIINMEDLSSNDIVNAEVRPIEDNEKVLGNFIILPSRIICLNYIEAFILDTKSISCDSLQSIEVGSNYTIILGEESYTHLQKSLSHTKTYHLEQGVYSEMTNTINNYQPNTYDSIIETVFLTKIGKVSYGKSTAFGFSMFLIAVIIFIICYWKCACCRHRIDNCCFLCMPACLHAWREKRALARLLNEELRAARLRQLDERANIDMNQNMVEGGHPGHVVAGAHHPEEMIAMPGAVSPPPSGCTQI